MRPRFFFFNDTATTEIYTLSLHDALPIYAGNELRGYGNLVLIKHAGGWISAYAHCDELLVKKGDPVYRGKVIADRKSTRLNSSHSQISYAVFCLKQKTYISAC